MPSPSTYSAKNARHFRAQIKRSAATRNAAVDNVKLKEGSNPDFTYEGGNDPRAVGEWLGSRDPGTRRGQPLIHQDRRVESADTLDALNLHSL
ncbi:snapalysin family zinc-dependent metalloprotease [Streptomyces sp. NPDC057099]|uniref:snapalysin family zinc-dependent metalloprotease n=1 Tax=Streptomyces sp. NPDC057099 TaxID=3346019 RepID=UPI003631909B